MRKLRRSQLNKIVAFCCFVLFLLIFFKLSAENDLGKKEKILIIERSINSPINHGECRLPNLPVYNPEIMKFYQPVEKIDCGNPLEDWVACEKSICFVKPEITAKHGEVTCSFTDLIRKTDYKVRYGKSIKTKEPYVLQESDFVKVACQADDRTNWSGMAFGIRDNVPHSVEFHQIIDQDDSTYPIQYNVLMLGFDSMSRNAYIRKLPKTYEYLTKELGAVVLQGYNIVGDGTPQALIPLLTGYTELELPETRKRISNAAHVDVYPMVWQDYAKHGYTTSFNEDLPNVGTFTYRMMGFQNQPVDHYMRTFYVEAENIWSNSKANCIGHQPDHKLMLEYTKQFMTKYSDTPRFVFSFHGGLSHDSINLIGAADSDVLEWLMSLREKQLLENTILIMMADHGNRFADVRATLQGKQEERLPFFSFAFPESFKKRFPQEYKNFVENAERLTTPFDVHATLKDILDLQQTQSEQTDSLVEYESQPPVDHHSLQIANQRAISLFKQIPKNRSCADAYIELHWCACLNWQTIELNNTAYTGLVIKLAGSIIETINSATHSYRQHCSQLTLDHVNWVMRLQPHKELLSFKSNSDRDGFLADMTGNTKLPNHEIYQLQIVVNPGQSLFEASVTHNLDDFTAHTKISEISRVNKYGSQANCIYERNPELRKYCYCRDQDAAAGVGN